MAATSSPSQKQSMLAVVQFLQNPALPYDKEQIDVRTVWRAPRSRGCLTEALRRQVAVQILREAAGITPNEAAAVAALPEIVSAGKQHLTALLSHALDAVPRLRRPFGAREQGRRRGARRLRRARR
jgi:hypothetical protein